MDPPAAAAKHDQNPNHLPNYFEETPRPFPAAGHDDDIMGDRSWNLLDEMLHHHDPNNYDQDHLPPLESLEVVALDDEKHMMNCDEILGFEDFDPIDDVSLWDWCDVINDDFNPIIVDDLDHCNLTNNTADHQANISSTTATAADHGGGRNPGGWDGEVFSCNDDSKSNYVIKDNNNSSPGDEGSSTGGGKQLYGSWYWWDDLLPILGCCNHDDDLKQPILDDDHLHVNNSNTSSCEAAQGNSSAGDHGGRRKPPGAQLSLEEIEKHFEKPIAMAAKELNVGLTVLKKRCRELNINRWPHRKLRSLKSLIQNVKEMGLKEEMEMLEEHKRMIEKEPEMKLTQKTKKLRQACYKTNYKKRRLLNLNQNQNQSPPYYYP